MHDGFHPHANGHDHGHSHGHHHPHGHVYGHSHAPRGHNHGNVPGQWQMPHLPEGTAQPVPDRERDLDLVEASFLEGFQAAADPTSFLRLAQIPFVGISPDGQRLHLLRVETSINADVGSVSPSFGGGAFLYDPLPARMVQQRKALAFVYHDGRGSQRLSFTEARRLRDETTASKIEFSHALPDAR